MSVTRRAREGRWERERGEVIERGDDFGRKRKVAEK